MIETHVMSALLACLPDKSDQDFLSTQSPEGDFELEALDMTSLRMVEVCMQLEQSLGVDIDLDEFEEVHSFRDLVAMCKELLFEQ